MAKKPTYEELEQKVQEFEDEADARRRAEVTLREHEQVLRMFVAHTPAPVAMCDKEMRYIVYSHRWASDYGLGEEDLIGRCHYDVFPDLPEHWKQEHKECLAGEIVRRDVEPFPRADGSIDWVKRELCPWRDDTDKIGGLIMFTEVITARKEAEEALREKERFHEGILNDMITFVAVLDPSGDVIFVNNTPLTVGGIKLEDIKGKKFFDGFWWTHSDEVREMIKRDIEQCASGESIIHDVPIQTADGSLMWIEFSMHPIYDEYGVVQYLIPEGRDITTNKKAEEALRESEEKYRLLVENANDAIYVAQDGVVKFPNAKTEQLTGYSAAELEKMPFVNHIHPDDREMVMERHKTGEELWHLLNTVSITWEGRPATLNFVRDITEAKRLEAQLQQAQKMEAIATLAGGVAHEFNNALMGIMGNIELLKMDLPEDERRDRSFGAMKDSSHRMSRLTDQLLAYAKGGKYQPKDLKLDNFVIQTLPILQHNLSPAVRVETHFPKDISYIKADYAQMQMVLSAILANSNEAIEDEGLIRITAENKDVDEDFTKQHPGLKPGYYVCLTIEDDGKGMDEETKDGIFEPFFTTKFQGRGMGMAAVYGIVKNHDGWISVDSELGKGTTVQIYLPALSAESNAQGSKGVKQPDIELAIGEGTILMIEDEDVVIEVTQTMLEMLGYRVMVAKTGKDAIHITETFDGRIDLALLDIKLPDMEGGKVYPLIMKARPDLKVIVFSGFAIE
ncbi:MAG: PAS domain S-box protein, partial [Deltaproteobacteria bacterium]|nr:PAS domain S-box protein [Deltaproteobacteria bacterium]